MLRVAFIATAMLVSAMLQGCASVAKSVVTPAGAAELPSRSEPHAAPSVAAPPPAPSPAPPRPAPAARNGRDAAPPRAAAAAPNGRVGFSVSPQYLNLAKRTKRARLVMSESAAPSPELTVDQERMRRRDDYITGLKKAAYTFNPPSPIKVAQPITVALWVDPLTEAAQLAEEMKKAFPESAARVESGATTWSPRMRATLTGVDFEITPVEGKDFNGAKGLSMTGRTEWAWTIVPTSPGKKKLHLLVWVVLPPELGEPRELPQINRDVEVEVTVWWLIDHYWEKYWKWMIGGLASAIAAAIAWWGKKRFGGGNA
jgi:hypothetical protein